MVPPSSNGLAIPPGGPTLSTVPGFSDLAHFRQALMERKELLAHLSQLDPQVLNPEAVRDVGRAYKQLIAELDGLNEAIGDYLDRNPS